MAKELRISVHEEDVSDTPGLVYSPDTNQIIRVDENGDRKNTAQGGVLFAVDSATAIDLTAGTITLNTLTPDDAISSGSVVWSARVRNPIANTPHDLHFVSGAGHAMDVTVKNGEDQTISGVWSAAPGAGPFLVTGHDDQAGDAENVTIIVSLAALVGAA